MSVNEWHSPEGQHKSIHMILPVYMTKRSVAETGTRDPPGTPRDPRGPQDYPPGPLRDPQEPPKDLHRPAGTFKYLPDPPGDLPRTAPRYPKGVPKEYPEHMFNSNCKPYTDHVGPLWPGRMRGATE